MKSLMTTALLLSALAGCASAPKIHQIEKVNVGTTTIFSSHINLAYTSWFKGTLNATSSDGQPELASRLNDRIMDAGFHVLPNQEPATYILREVFAGNAVDYVSKEPSRGSISPKTIFAAVVGFTACGVMRACSDVGVMSNQVFDTWSDIGTDLSRKTSPELDRSENTGAKIVVTEVCSKRGCARSIAASRDSLTTIAQLRVTNIDEGVLRAINIKK